VKDLNLLDCHYSPAKRRGPVPGQRRRGHNAISEISSGMNGAPVATNEGSDAMYYPKAYPPIVSGEGERNVLNPNHTSLAHDTYGFTSAANHHSYYGDSVNAYSQNSGGLYGNLSYGHLQAGAINGNNAFSQQQDLYPNPVPQVSESFHPFINMENSSSLQQQQQQQIGGSNSFSDSPQFLPSCPVTEPVKTRRIRLVDKPSFSSDSKSPRKHFGLLSPGSEGGILLRSYFQTSVNELFRLPPIPSDQEYCERRKLDLGRSVNALPSFDWAALQAARFSELALGALVSNQISLALELSNATVYCLRQCVEEPVHPSCMFELARAYLLHGIFRSFRGDMLRYFKYRRVCMIHLTQLKAIKGTLTLLAAISIQDSWAYMMYNAGADYVPKIDGQIAPLPELATSVNDEEDPAPVRDISKIVRDPKNQVWIQGTPPIFVDNSAPSPTRALDALSCAIRSCCDKANVMIEDQLEEAASVEGRSFTPKQFNSVTARAVLANESELCSRNIILSTEMLMKQEVNQSESNSFLGIECLLKAMSVFLDEGSEHGFSESQLDGLLKTLNAFIQFPSMLWHAGPSYHLFTNATIMVCHFLNGMHQKRHASPEGLNAMENAMFEEFHDTFIAARKLLMAHRNKLPHRIRCHGIPRSNPTACKDEPIVDLNGALLCGCRGCQNFVLMGISPCVAAEREASGRLQRELELRNSNEELECKLDQMKDEYDLDDDHLLHVLSKIISG